MELFLSHHWLLFSQIVCDWHSLFWNIVHWYSPNTPRWWVLKCLCLGPPRGGGWFIYCCRAGFITSLREALFPAGQSNRHDAFTNYKLQNWVLKKYPLHPWPAHQLTATLHPLTVILKSWTLNLRKTLWSLAVLTMSSHLGRNSFVYSCHRLPQM